MVLYVFCVKETLIEVCGFLFLLGVEGLLKMVPFGIPNVRVSTIISLPPILLLDEGESHWAFPQEWPQVAILKSWSGGGGRGCSRNASRWVHLAVPIPTSLRTPRGRRCRGAALPRSSDACSGCAAELVERGMNHACWHFGCDQYLLFICPLWREHIGECRSIFQSALMALVLRRLELLVILLVGWGAICCWDIS